MAFAFLSLPFTMIASSTLHPEHDVPTSSEADSPVVATVIRAPQGRCVRVLSFDIGYP